MKITIYFIILIKNFKKIVISFQTRLRYLDRKNRINIFCDKVFYLTLKILILLNICDLSIKSASSNFYFYKFNFAVIDKKNIIHE